MTEKQRRQFFGHLWPQACAAQGWDRFPDSEREKRRKAIVTRICGYDSMTCCNQAQLTAIFNEVRLLANPLDLKAARAVANPAEAARDDDRKRLLFRIQRLGSESYIESIIRDRFNTARLADLSNAQLDQLRITLIERRRSSERRLKLLAATT